MHLAKPILLVAACGLFACQETPTPREPDSLFANWTGEPDQWLTLSVFTGSHSLLDEEKVWEACLQWMPKGVICDLVTDRQQADVTIDATDEKCDVKSDGTYTIGWASSNGVNGRITIMAACPGWNDSQLIGVLAHELGHVIGIWKHVPLDCDEPHLTHSNGQAVCGVATMNPMHNNGLYYTTPIDGLAFDLRDRQSSLLRPFGQAATLLATAPKLTTMRAGLGGGFRCGSH